MISARHLPHIAIFLFLVAIAGCNRSAPRKPVSATADKSAGGNSMVRPVSYNMPSLKGEHVLNTVCDTDSHLTIRSVWVTDTKTIIDLTFNNVKIGDEVARDRIRTAAPGQLNAFYIADPNKRAEYALLNVEGIAVEPKWTQLRDGDVMDFRLTFERLPDSLTSFHLIEGKVPAMDSNQEPVTTWTFMNVRLK